jgi:hypothetical protein
VAESREASQLDEFRRLGIVLGQFVDQFIKGQQVDSGFVRDDGRLLQRQPLAAAARFDGASMPCPFHQYPPHRFRGCGEEVSAAVPAELRLVGNEPDIGLMDQRGRLKRVAGGLTGQLVRCQPSEFVVDERQQIIGLHDAVAEYQTGCFERNGYSARLVAAWASISSEQRPGRKGIVRATGPILADA